MTQGVKGTFAINVIYAPMAEFFLCEKSYWRGYLGTP